MFIKAKMVLESYIPNDITTDTLFKRHVKQTVLKTLIEYDEVYQLKELPRNRENIIIDNGYPVQPVIFSITANPDENAHILVHPAQIDIDAEDINHIIGNWNGDVYIDVIDEAFEEGIVVPVLEDNKVILAAEEQLEWSDDYDEDTPPDDYEDDGDEDDDEFDPALILPNGYRLMIGSLLRCLYKYADKPEQIKDITQSTYMTLFSAEVTPDVVGSMVEDMVVASQMMDIDDDLKKLLETGE